MVRFDDNSAEALEGLEAAINRGLWRCAMQAVTFAKENITENGTVDTGNLRNSIKPAVDLSRREAYVGTNSEYGAYVEKGTGKYYPGGRAGWWVYVVENGEPIDHTPRDGAGKTYTFEEAKKIMAILRSKGLDAHMTEGRPEAPFIRPAVADHADFYKAVMKDEMKG